MERIYQMNVVPNVLPILKPSLDLHVVARTRPSEFLKTGKVQSEVEPGVFLRPKQVNSSFFSSVFVEGLYGQLFRPSFLLNYMPMYSIPTHGCILCFSLILVCFVTLKYIGSRPKYILL